MPLSTGLVQILGNAWLRNTVSGLPTTVYLGLLTTAPTALDGTGYVELNPATHTWYGRLAMTMAAPVGRTFSNSAAVNFGTSTTVVPSPVTHAMAFSSGTYGGGIVLAWGLLTSPITIGIGSPVNFPIGQLVFDDPGT